MWICTKHICIYEWIDIKQKKICLLHKHQNPMIPARTSCGQLPCARILNSKTSCQSSFCKECSGALVVPYFIGTAKIYRRDSNNAGLSHHHLFCNAFNASLYSSNGLKKTIQINCNDNWRHRTQCWFKLHFFET